MLPRATRLFAVTAALGIAVACGGGSTEAPPAASGSSPASPASAVSTDKNAYPVFPNADAGADPAVPAEQGGKGFTGQGWETNTDFDFIGDPHAIKGGTFRQATLTDFPTTLRYYGPNQSIWNYVLHTMVYETLLGLHPSMLEYIPALATHWQISADKKTFRFRLDPNARWSDGQPVVADDVVASYKLVMDKTLQDPARTQIYSNFETPVVESKYIVSVTAKTVNWQNFLNFSNSLFIYPAHILKDVNGDRYIKEWNYKMLPGTGPYMVSEPDIVKGQSLKLRRRKDYWAEKQRRNVGISNFDEIQQIVVRDRNLEFEMFKKGDIDYYFVQRAQMWVQELDYPNIKRGLNQKRKVFNNNPQGLQGIAFNTRREPYNDIRVRKGLAHLFNRELMVQKMAFNEYSLMDSMFSGSIYENPNNEKIRYDPQKALQLLAEAGYKDRDSNGRLVKNARPLTLELVYADQASERYFTVYQEDLRKVGISLNLRFVTFETLLKLIDERTFDLMSGAYTGEIFPNPEASLLSRLADEKNTNNLTGFKNQRADQIIAEYAKAFDIPTRVKLMQELDGIFTNDQQWIMEWTAPYQRFVYWNKFGTPKGYITRIGDHRDIASMWWNDPVKAQALAEAQRDSSKQLGEGPSDDKYWLEFAKTQAEPNP